MKINPPYSTYSIYAILGILFLCFPIIDLLIGFNEKQFLPFTIGLWGMFWLFFLKKKKITLQSTDYLIIVFLGYQVIHFGFSPYSFYHLPFLWRISLTTLYFIFRFSFGNNKKELLKTTIGFVLLRFGIESSIAWLQYFKILQIAKSDYFPVSGTFKSPNFLALLIVLGISVITSIFLNKKCYKKVKYNIGYVFIMLTNIFLLIILESRTALLTLGVSLLFQVYFFTSVFQKIKKYSTSIKISILTILFCLGTITISFFYNQKKDSVDGRLLTSKIISKEITKAPFWGHGLFSFVKTYNKARTDYFTIKERSWMEIKNSTYLFAATNDYLEVFLETGIISILLVIGILWSIVYKKKWTLFEQKLGSILIIILTLAAFFTSVSRFGTFLCVLILATLLVIIPSDEVKKDSIVIKYSLVTKLFILLFFSYLFTASTLRIYANTQLKKHWNLSENKQALTAPLKDYKTWFEIIEDHERMTFHYGNFLYDQKTKKMGMLKMKEGIANTVAPRLIRKLAHIYFKQRDFPKTEKLLIYNTYNEPYRFKPKMDLARFYKGRKDTIKMISVLHEILELPIKIPSKKADQIKQFAKKELQQIQPK